MVIDGMSDEEWAEKMAKKQKEEGDKLYEEMKKNALEAGKEPFDAEKMDSLWVSRFRSSMNEEQTIADRKELEKGYYLYDDAMTIKEFAAFKKMLDNYD